MEQFDPLPIQCKYIEHMHEGVWFRKKIIFDKKDSSENIDDFSLLRLFCLYIDGAFMGRSTPTTAFDGTN